VSTVLQRVVINSFVSYTYVNGTANFVFVQLIEQKPGIYDKRHPDYDRRNKLDSAWEKTLMRRRSLDQG
jgi:hypothetical protein